MLSSDVFLLLTNIGGFLLRAYISVSDITWLHACVAGGDTPFTTVIPLPHLQTMSSSREGEARTGAGQSTGEKVRLGGLHTYLPAAQNSNIIKEERPV